MSNRGHAVTKSQAPAVEIAAFNPVTSPKSENAARVHPSTPLHQLVGNSANGHATTNQRLPPSPIRADDNTGKVLPVPAVAWGMDKTPSPHDPSQGEKVMQEAEAQYLSRSLHHCGENGDGC